MNAPLSTRYLSHKIKGVEQIPGTCPDPWQRFERKAACDEFDDRGGVILRVIDVATLGIGRNNERRNAGARPPAVAFGGWHMIPEATVFIVGHNDGRLCPQGARLNLGDDVCDMLVAGSATQVMLATRFRATVRQKQTRH